MVGVSIEGGEDWPRQGKERVRRSKGRQEEEERRKEGSAAVEK
jgi:hypothetical protein